MRYIIGTDHAGYNIKHVVIDFLVKRGIEVLDLSPSNSDRVDYPDYAKIVCEEMLKDLPNSRGILICGTGIGMSMTANKYPNIRAALCTDTYMARITRAHNDANVLCLGERISGVGEIEDMLLAFISTEFDGGRHTQRVEKIERDLNK